MKLSELINKAPLSRTQSILVKAAQKLVSGLGAEKPILVDETFLGKPPANIGGDVALACFKLAKTLKMSPKEVAKQLQKSFHSTEEFLKAQAVGPYLNLFLNRELYAQLVFEQIISEQESYGHSKVGKGKRIMMEYSSPNTNKPQHLGHIRNNLLGWTVAHLLEACGFKLFKTSIVNDRGIHICKSMLAYQKWGGGTTPESVGVKPDHLVGNYYVLFEEHLAKEEESYAADHGVDLKQLSGDEDKKAFREEFLAHSTLMAEAREMLQKWEQGDPEIVALWKKMNGWVYEGFNQTYRELGVDFDKTYYESDIYQGGRDIIMRAVKDGNLVKRPDGSIVAPLKEKFGFPDKVVLRADGTSLYITQDLNLARIKFDDFPLDYSIYCIGNEQDLYMQQLFSTLRLIGFPWAEKLLHLSYGMVYLPEGKMKSREGKVVDADDLVSEMAQIAEELIRKRYADLSDSEIAKRSRAIGLAAIKFYMLGVKKSSSITFDPKRSIAFEGRTGPYLQYTFARACSVLKKSKCDELAVVYGELEIGDEEWALIKLLPEFPEGVYQAAINCEPALLVEKLYSIAQAFNQFYHFQPILKAEETLKDFRLLLTKVTKQVLGNGLDLLGIEKLEEM